MKLIRIVCAAAVLAASTSLALAQNVPAPAKEKPSPAATAQESLAKWQQSRRDCFRAAGLAEGKDWRFRPDNPMKTQIADSYWLANKPDPKCQ